MGARPVQGTAGPLSFAWDAQSVEFVPSSGGLRLRIRGTDGKGFESTEITSVTTHEIDEEPWPPRAEDEHTVAV